MNRKIFMSIVRDVVRSAGIALLAIGSGMAAAEDEASESIVLPENVEAFTVRTSSGANQNAPFYLRIPKGYDPERNDKVHRVLFICPIYNGDGAVVITGRGRYSRFLKLADERGWFVLSATFINKSDPQNRKTCYYYPESFSGKAILRALREVERKYPVDTHRLLLEGFSGGAQFVHRFAIAVPERVTAVAVNSCSWFDPPTADCKRSAWLLTVGESDPSYHHSAEMVDQLRAVGVVPLFRSYLGMGHEDSQEVDRLTLAFLEFYDEATKHHLGKEVRKFVARDDSLPMSGEEMPFVGDSLSWKVWTNTEENRALIAEDVLIYLPNRKIVEEWGSLEDES